jgi:hypothetical protein
LFFECNARALAGEEPFTNMLPGAVTIWLDAMAPVAARQGRASARANASTRLALAVLRGLLLDLLATGDRAGTTAALDAFAHLVSRSAPSETRGP